MERGEYAGSHAEHLRLMADEAVQAIANIVRTADDQREQQIQSTHESRSQIIWTARQDRLTIISRARADRIARIEGAVVYGHNEVNRLREFLGGNTDDVLRIEQWMTERVNLIYQRETEKQNIIENREADVQTNILSREQTAQSNIDIKRQAARNNIAPNGAEQTSVAQLMEKISRYQTILAQVHRDEYTLLDKRTETALSDLANRVGTADTELDSRLRNFKIELENKITAARHRFSQSRQQNYHREQYRSDYEDHGRQEDQGTSSRSDPPQEASEDPRIKILMGKETSVPTRPYKIVLANIDHHRAKGSSDEEIFKLLIRNFHPDRSDHEQAESISRVLNGSYDKQKKQFRV